MTHDQERMNEQIAHEIITQASAQHLGWDKQLKLIEAALDLKDTDIRQAREIINELKADLAKSQERVAELTAENERVWKDKAWLVEQNTLFRAELDGLRNSEAEQIIKLRARVEELLAAEHKLSDAYLRIRTKLDAFITPHAPSAEQVYAVTELKLDQLIARVESLEAERKLGNIPYKEAIEIQDENKRLRAALTKISLGCTDFTTKTIATDALR